MAILSRKKSSVAAPTQFPAKVTSCVSNRFLTKTLPSVQEIVAFSPPSTFVPLAIRKFTVWACTSDISPISIVRMSDTAASSPTVTAPVRGSTTASDTARCPSTPSGSTGSSVIFEMVFEASSPIVSDNTEASGLKCRPRLPWAGAASAA